MNPEKHEPKKGAPKDPELQNEGEGSRSGARRYDQGATETAKHPGHVEEAAKKAAEALDGEEGKALREAERRGKTADHR